jgi:S-adenosylmethionine-diacylglycerol 3-amino-3-carboxypropyl transferase
MPRANDLQFAVVREDPAIEATLLRAMTGRRVFLIASGGCTALHLASEFPDLDITALDANPSQIRHVRSKIEALARHDGLDEWQELSQRGNFESLFRGLREFLEEMVAAPEEWDAALSNGSRSVGSLLDHKYWPVAFDLYFHDKILLAMFGRQAIQHAAPGSYPRYFQRSFEMGLQRPDRTTNYFLHHVLLGRYVPQALPAFLAEPPASLNIRLVESTVDRAPCFGHFDLISLSNLFDWMEPRQVSAVTRRLSEEVCPGAVVIVRQLNNDVDLTSHLPGFRFDTALARELLARDRSLFYNRLLIGTREAA